MGAAASAALGFAFSLLLARGLGADGAGVVLQAIGCFTIALGLARLGLDTTAVWLLLGCGPRNLTSCVPP